MLLYFTGSFVLAFGVILMAKGDLGTTPVNSIAFVLSRILSVNIGIMSALIFSGYVLLQLAILRRDFRPVDIFQVAVSVLYGSLLSLFDSILSFPAPEFYPLRLLLVLVGVVIIGFGIFLYLRAAMVPQPPEGLILAIEKKTDLKLHNIKIISDSTLVVVSVVISLIAGGGIAGIREGTLIAMLGIGKALGFFTEQLGEKVDRLFRL